MGRTPTIDKSDVLRARDTLRQSGLPHGIIAIRKQIGRGSPTLIARLLRELDGHPLVSAALQRDATARIGFEQPVRKPETLVELSTPPTLRQESSESAWQAIIANQQTEQDEWRRALLDKDTELQRMRERPRVPKWENPTK